MRRTSRYLIVLFTFVFVLIPVLAEAGPGQRSGSGIGSRGERTYSTVPSTNTAPGGAGTIQRSQTPPSSGPSYNAPGYAQAPARGGFFQRHPFLGGLLAGGAIGMLFGGHGFFGGGDFMSLIGLLLQVLIIVMIVRWVIRLVRGPSPQPAGGRPAMPQQPAAYAAQGGSGGGAPQRTDTVGIVPTDYQAFEQTLLGVQAAWTNRDRDGIMRLVTPEIFQFLTDEVVEDDRHGRLNRVEKVKLLQGDLAEAWNEGARDYATVAMRFSCVDYTLDRASNRVIEGSNTQMVEKVEVWTFVRPHGGAWVVSAIQQTR